MKTSPFPLTSFILVCLFQSILSSNPDAVLVQDSSENDGESKSAPIRMKDQGSATVPDSSEEDSKYKPSPTRIEDPDSVIMLDSSKGKGGNRSASMRFEDRQQRAQRGEERSRVSIVVRRPYGIDSSTVWREIGLQSFNGVRYQDPTSSVWRDFYTHRRVFSGSTGQNSFRRRPYSGNVPQRPQSNNDGVQAYGLESVANLPSNNEPNNPLPGTDGNSFGYRNNVAQNSPPQQSNNPQNRRQQGYDPNNSRFGINAANLPSNDEPNMSPPGTDGNSFVNRNNGAQNLPPQRSNYNSQNRRRQGYNPNNPRSGVNAANFGQRRAPLPTQTPVNQRQRPSPLPGNTSNGRVSPDSNFFAGIVNNLAFKLVEALNMESNFVVSPLSIFIALSMCYLGSDGRTKAQLEQVLGMDDNSVHGEHLHQGIMDLISLITAESSRFELLSANGMFLGKNFTTNAQFEDDIRKYYAAELMNLDFSNPQESLSVINEWVARNSRNMIPNIISVPPSAQTRLILMNAIYFRGIWKTMFPVNSTLDMAFRSVDGTYKEVPTMTLQGESFPFFRSDEHRHSFIKLPYDGDQMSMIIALPYAESDIPMASMTDQILCYLRDAMVNTQFDVVGIPKFRLESTSSLETALMELGITDIFTRNVVNLSKLRKENDVYVSDILHKAVLEVNEEGTTAGSATGVRFVPLTVRNMTNFIANHPFAFYIVHERSGLVVFYGKILDLDGKPLDNRRENVNVRPLPNPEGNRGENVNVRPMPNPEGNRRGNVNVRPMPNPEDNRRENVNGRPRPIPEGNRRENLYMRPRQNPEDNRRENVRLRPNPEDNGRENINVRSRPSPENRRENLNVRPRPSPEGFRGTTVNRNRSRTGVHGAVNFENTD